MSTDSRPAPHMSIDDRVRALLPLGFTARQTRFLVTVALHGGYCLRRQYLEFAGVRHGKGTREFFDRLVRAQLAARIPCRSDRGNVYHLSSKTLYRSIGQEDNRNRRLTSAALMARKVMLLDFVLSRPDAHWLATEQDKVAYFTSTLGVPRSVLPGRIYTARDAEDAPTTRYFVHKLPIFVTTVAASTSSHPGAPLRPSSHHGATPPRTSPHFVYLALEASASGFEQFLRDHAPLFSRLPSWTVVAIAPPGSPGLQAARDAFARQFGETAPTAKPPGAASIPELRWYFSVRRRVEADDFGELSVADLDRYRRLRERHTTLAHESQYAHWLQHGDAALDASSAAPCPPGSLVTHVLPHGYTQFGSMPGVA